MCQSIKKKKKKKAMGMHRKKRLVTSAWQEIGGNFGEKDIEYGPER